MHAPREGGMSVSTDEDLSRRGKRNPAGVAANRRYIK